VTNKKDERGSYKGFSSMFDEWIPVYSPRIMPWASRVGKPEIEVLDLEDDMDSVVGVPVGMKRVYAVPRAFN